MQVAFLKCKCGFGFDQEVIGVALDGEFSVEEASGRKLLETLGAGVGELQAASAAGGGAAARVKEQAGDLRAGLAEAGDGFLIGRIFAETVRRCCDLLDRAGSQAEASDAAYGFAEAAPDARYTEAMYTEAIYTMEAERKVHRALIGEQSKGPLEGFADRVQDGEDQEVEFF